jgi:ferrous iron transport protein B
MSAHGSVGLPTLPTRAPIAPFSPPSRGPRLVALVGPPNCGKSTLFNRLTGLRQKVANFPGVTVEQRRGKARLHGDREVVLVDLPGVYSLTARSEDERVTRDVLMGTMPGTSKPDAVLLILDSTNLNRQLVLAAPILSLGIPTLVVLNMADELADRGGAVDAGTLAARLGVPVALVSATKGDGVEMVREFLSGAIGIPPSLDLPVLGDIPKCRQWAVALGDEARYSAPAPPIWTRRLDAVFLHPVAGPLVFLAVVVAVFQSIFTAARPLMDAVDHAVTGSGAWLSALLPDNPLKSLLIEGIWGGVGSVVIFLPQILLLFAFIGFLEDSGYLARAALIADRTMRKAGLQGKSFLPLLSAYACAVPAVLSARTIENKRDRIATILIAPFMTCSARLPIYTLIIAAFLPERPLLGPFLGTRAAAMIGLYVLGFLAAFGTARLLKSSVLKSDGAPFMLEMPPYRVPTVRQIVLRMYDRAKIFLRRAGTVILGVAIALWILAHLPLTNGKMPEIANSVVGTIGHTIEPLVKPLGFDWRIGIGIVTSLAAREVIVGTLGTLYGMDPKAAGEGLQAALRHDLSAGGAVALLVFFAFAMQCLSTVAVVRRETGGWKWPVIQFAYMGLLAYSGAFIANRLVTLLVS